MSKDYEELKKEMKEEILKIENEIMRNNEQLDSQQVVNRIVRKYEEISKE